MVGTPSQKIFQDCYQSNSLEETNIGEVVKGAIPMPITVDFQYGKGGCLDEQEKNWEEGQGTKRLAR